MTANHCPSENGLAQRAYLTMRERIMRGDFAIGQVISRRKLAAELGISFLPASEAMLRLECEGLLESRPRAGTRVRIPMREDVLGHFMVREALEVQSAMMFAANATEAQRDQLTQIASRLDSDPALYAELHESLHLKIAEATQCVALIEALRKRSALESAWRSSMRATPLHDRPRHEPLVHALTRRKPPIAAAAMRAHMQAELQSTLESMDPWFDSNRKHLPKYTRVMQKKAAPATPVELPAA